MQAYVSLWSADLLDVGRAIDSVAGVADGFHLDVFDGHNVDDLLFGPDFVAAVRRRTTLTLDVHLNVEDPDRWARRFLDVGADMVTVQTRACPDVEATLAAIRAGGGLASLGVEINESLADAARHDAAVDRYLVMGSPLGIKGVAPSPETPGRVSELRQLSSRHRPVFVDGGVRAETVGTLAAAGAAGVIPGSLVFDAPDPGAAIDRLHRLG